MSAALGTLERYSQGQRKTVFGESLGIGRWIAQIFGCQHRDMSRPFSRHGETYRVCISCGARRQFDEKTWNSAGRHYFKPARTSDLQDIDMTALRCI